MIQPASLHSIGSLLLVAGLMFGCSKKPSSEKVLAGAVRQIEDSRAVHYKYKATWDNRFNETKYQDSGRVIYSRPDSSLHGFAFFVSNRGNEYLFDGFNYKEYRHGEKMIVRHEADEIKADPAYFSGKMFFAYTPFELTKEKAFDSSPVDKKTALRPYLDKKGFPFTAFSKESGMNEDFSVYAFPTFVLIGADGVVRKVVSGFGAEAREMILEQDAR